MSHQTKDYYSKNVWETKIEQLSFVKWDNAVCNINGGPRCLYIFGEFIAIFPPLYDKKETGKKRKTDRIVLSITLLAAFNMLYRNEWTEHCFCNETF